MRKLLIGLLILAGVIAAVAVIKRRSGSGVDEWDSFAAGDSYGQASTTAGKATDADITSYGKVDQAVIADGKVFLKMGDVSVPLEDVIRISKPTETADPGSDDGDSGDDETDAASET